MYAIRSYYARVLTDGINKNNIIKLIKEESWARDIYDKLKVRTDYYAQRDPQWLTSRLQMFV